MKAHNCVQWLEPRAGGAEGFSIGSKGYVGIGTSGNDFREYDQAANTWTQKADFVSSFE
jgi:hypothetical protein